MPTPPVTRKPIPGHPKHWRAELMGVWRFLHRVQGMEALHGDKWVRSQYTYSKTRLLDLIDNPPDKATVPPRLRKWRKTQ